MNWIRTIGLKVSYYRCIHTSPKPSRRYTKIHLRPSIFEPRPHICWRRLFALVPCPALRNRHELESYSTSALESFSSLPSSTVPDVVTTNWLEKNMHRVVPLCAVLPDHFWYKVLVNVPTKNAIQYIFDLFTPKAKQPLRGKPWIDTVTEAYKDRLEFEKWYVSQSNPQVMSIRSERKKSNPDCHENEWIPGSRAIRLDYLSEADSIFPYMTPTQSYFLSCTEKLNIQPSDHIVIYGKDLGDVTATDPTSVYPIAAAAKLRSLLKIFGFPNVSVLDGNIAKWVAEGRSVEMQPKLSMEDSSEESEKSSDTTELQLPASLISYNTLLNTVVDFAATKKTTILDVRSEIEFRGNHKQISQTCGHIPTSRHVPIDELFSNGTSPLVQQDESSSPQKPQVKDEQRQSMLDEPTLKPRTLKSPAQLKNLFEDLGIPIHDPEHKLILVSNLGISASLLELCLNMVGKTENVFLYDGGWTEWRAHKSSPISRWA